jgi:hypothetical protein
MERQEQGWKKGNVRAENGSTSLISESFDSSGAFCMVAPSLLDFVGSDKRRRKTATI